MTWLASTIQALLDEAKLGKLDPASIVCRGVTGDGKPDAPIILCHAFRVDAETCYLLWHVDEGTVWLSSRPIAEVSSMIGNAKQLEVARG